MSVELIGQENRLWLSLAQGALLESVGTEYAKSFIQPKQDGEEKLSNQIPPIVDWQGRVIQTNDLILYVTESHHDVELRLARVLEIGKRPCDSTWDRELKDYVREEAYVVIRHYDSDDKSRWAVRKPGDKSTIGQFRNNKQWATFTRYDGITDYPMAGRENDWRTPIRSVMENVD